MAKNNKRPKPKAKAADDGGRNQNVAKQSKHAQTQKAPSTIHVSWLRKNAHFILAICSFVVLAVLLFATRTNDGDNGHLVPHIDGIGIEPDPNRGEKIQYFLDNFVCNYRPDADTKTDSIARTLDIEGYCHPRLIADPLHRTHRVSSSSISDSWALSWWRKILSMTIGGVPYSDHGILKGELVMRLPRPLQIWDLDALRDRFIQQEFLGLGATSKSEDDLQEEPSPRVVARHKMTRNPLDSGAFLAVYLIRLLHGSQAEKDSSKMDSDGQCSNDIDECNLHLKWDNLDQHKQRLNTLTPYLDILPTVNNRIEKSSPPTLNPHDHPLLWSVSLLKSLFPRNTYTYDLIRHYQQMIESEYEALKLASDEFGNNVKYMEYLNMRINVLSRAFGVPASTHDKGLLWGTSDITMGQSITDEMKMYETSNFGRYLDNVQDSSAEVEEGLKLRSMCPLLDMYNSHPNENVSWRYNSKTSSYDIRSSRKSNIPPGHSLVVSYGKYTDGHLFAKYGYVNGDGSSPTENSLAVFHRMIGDVGLGRQFSLMFDEGSNVDLDDQKGLTSKKKALELQSKELLRYLIFDDGYKECIDLTSNSDSTDQELKLLKLRHLIQIANYREAWIVRVPPKDPDAAPLQNMGSTSTRHDTKQPNDPVGINAHRVISICRLLSLRVDDIGGKAIEYLEEGLTSSESEDMFFIEKHEDELEYRAMMCVIRLCNVALGRYLGYDQNEPSIIGSREWNAWYVITGEVRVLGILQQIAAKEASKVEQMIQSTRKISATDEAMIVRHEGACPLNYSLPLLSML